MKWLYRSGQVTGGGVLPDRSSTILSGPHSIIHSTVPVPDFGGHRHIDGFSKMDRLEQARALFLDGLQRLQQEDYLGAVDRLREALSLMPERVSILTNLGAVLIKVEQYDEAQRLLEKAGSIDESLPEVWLNLGLIQKERYDCETAIRRFDRALALDPGYVEALSNKGACLNLLNRQEEALDCFEAGLALNPRSIECLRNRTNSLIDLRRSAEALRSCEELISQDPGDPESWSLKASCLGRLKRWDGMVAALERALELDPDADFVLGRYLHKRLRLCDWDGIDSMVDELISKIKRGEAASPPFELLGLVDDPMLQRQAAEIWTQRTCPARQRQFATTDPARGQRIRVGYFSADFHDHATSYLMAQLFETHDRSRFELIGFSFGPDTDDEMRRRVSAAFDQFVDVRETSDADVAGMSREMGIDIAVDLKGFTRDARPGIFAERAAPIQVSYLGYPGTMGADYIDYLIADATLIPPGSEAHYAEKIVYLPDSYQVNDRHRRIAEATPTRRDMNLTDAGFVFCCFNNTYKITPKTFDSWMRMLKGVEGSVLWLLNDTPIAVANLRREAEKRGIDGERLVFADRMPLEHHLARHRLADLFLDTLPYNAHTTTSDALWAGLPVITCTGKSFASRVAASLLRAVEMPELITTSARDFERLGIELANDPGRLKRIREKLWRNRTTAPLFDTGLFTRNIERAYEQIHERHLSHLRPMDIVVDPEVGR